MRYCPLCGTRFDGEDYHFICGNCWDNGEWDGSQEQSAMLKCLHKLKNPPGGRWTDDDYKMAADSSAGPEFAEEIMVRMERGCFKNLLKKVMARIE